MICMTGESTTLMGREEQEGSTYPLWIERLFLLSAVVVFAVFRSDVQATVEHGLLGVILAYVVFPLTLLASIELIGRAIQRSLGS